METILAEIYSISIYQWLATVFSLVYIFFAVNNKAICFVFGLLSALFWAYESFIVLNLKFDAFLQIFYAGMSIYGLYLWKFKNEESSESLVLFFGFGRNVYLILGGVVLSIFLFYSTQGLFETQKAFIDLLTTVFSVLATFLLIYRYIDNWMYWVIIDIVYIYLYWIQGGILFALIMLIYAIMAVMGYKNWKKLYLDAI